MRKGCGPLHKLCNKNAVEKLMLYEKGGEKVLKRLFDVFTDEQFNKDNELLGSAYLSKKAFTRTTPVKLKGANIMRQTIFSIIFALCAGLCYAQSNNPFLTPSGTRWQGRINYTDASNVHHGDFYEIIFVANGTCIVSIRATENGEELFQDGDGLWSYDENFLRVECDFIEAVIERLPSIRWVSVYRFDTPLNRFTLLVPPYPDAKNNVRLQMIKTED